MTSVNLLLYLYLSSSLSHFSPLYSQVVTVIVISMRSSSIALSVSNTDHWLRSAEWVVEVVTFEELLNLGLLYQSQRLLELLILLILKTFVYYLQTKIVFIRRHKRRFNLSIIESFPVKPLQPRLSLHLIHPKVPQSLHLLTLNQLIYKVSCIQGPTLGNISFSDLGLPLENLISYILSIFAIVRSASHHAFIGNYSKCVIVDSEGMVLFAKYFWCHVWGSSTGFSGVVLL